MPTRSHQSNHDLGVKHRFQNDSFPSCFVTKMGSQKVTELSQTRLPRQIWEGPKMEPCGLQVPLASGCKARSKWSGVEGQVCFRNRWVVWRGNGRCVAGAVGDVWLVVLQVAGGRGRWQGGRWPWQVAGGRWPVAVASGRWHVAGGRGRWPWQVEVAGGRWPWQVAVAGRRGRWPWQVAVAGGRGRWPWQVAVAGGCGRWPWQVAVAGGTWQVARWPWQVAGGRGRWPPATPTCGRCHLPPATVARPPATWHVPPATATCHGHLPRPPATSCLHLPLATCHLPPATPATLSTLSTPATPATAPHTTWHHLPHISHTPAIAPPHHLPHHLLTCHSTCLVWQVVWQVVWQAYLSVILSGRVHTELGRSQRCTLSWEGPRLRSSGAHWAGKLAKSLAKSWQGGSWGGSWCRQEEGNNSDKI